MSELSIEARLARLREAFPSDQALADTLDTAEGTINGLANGNKDIQHYPDVETKARRLHKQIQKEHKAGLDAVSYALQTIERLKAGTITDEKLDNVQQVLQQKADDLNKRYAE